MKRREFLKTACLATTCILPACKSTVKYADAIRQGNKLVVDKSLFLANSMVTIAYNQHGIGITKLDGNTFVASLLTCTHQGCAVSVEENGFICPCHGARFDNIGQVTKGPAEENLTRFITSTDQQFVYVHLS
jgi:cytochrome b6-f complex iron-sulfur subunit